MPHGVAEPLHLLEGEAGFPWFWLVLSLLTLLLLLWRLRRRKVAAPVAVAPTATAAASGFTATVTEIRRAARAALDYRRGCHELSLAIRRKMEARGGLRTSRLTARELEARLGTEAPAQLLNRLGALQFGRRAPGAEDLDSVCEHALAVDSFGGFDLAARPEGNER